VKEFALFAATVGLIVWGLSRSEPTSSVTSRDGSRPRSDAADYDRNGTNRQERAIDGAAPEKNMGINVNKKETARPSHPMRTVKRSGSGQHPAALV
jgi:hypothetical protein